MTDPLEPDLAPAAELASALHDGEAGADERARAEADEVRAARRRVEAVAAVIAMVPAPPAGSMDEHVAAALAAFDGGAEDVEPASGAPVVALADRRAWWRRVPLGAVAAVVAVIALVGAIGLLASSDERDRSVDTATAALEADEGGADDADASPGVASSGATTLAAGEREAFPGYDELAASLADRVRAGGAEAADGRAAEAEDPASPPAGSEAAPAPTAGDAAPGCDPVAAAGIDPASLELAAAVLVDGRPVTALVHRDGPARVLTSVDEASCAVADRRPLP